MKSENEMTKDAVALVQPTELINPEDELDSILESYSGAGTSTKQEHISIPLIYVLQSNSPQVGERNPLHIENAKPGDLWLRNAASPIVSGMDGLIFQPVHFQWVVVEWKPEREGFVQIHEHRPEDAVEQLKDKDDPDSGKQWVRSTNHNIVTDTCYVYGLVDMEIPYVIPLSSTGYRVARDWNTDLLNRKRNGKILPVFATKYKLRTIFRTNKKGDWFSLAFNFIPELLSIENVKRGLELFKSVSSGERRAEQEESAIAEPEPNLPF